MEDSKSMLRKRADRRAAKHYHQDDAVFASGHAVHTDESRLHKSGVRGRKSVVLAVVFGFVVVVAVGNLIVTALLISVLRMTPEGVPSLHIGSKGLLVFRKPTKLASVYVDRFLGSFKNENLSLESDGELSVSVGVGNESRTKFALRQNEVLLNPRESFQVVSKNGSVLFNPESGMILNRTVNGRKLVVRNRDDEDNTIQAGKIGHSRLELQSKSTTDLSGGTNVLIKTAQINVDASTIDVKTQLQDTGRIHLVAQEGVYINITDDSAGTSTLGTHVLCACLKNNTESDAVYAKLYVSRSSERCLAYNACP